MTPRQHQRIPYSVQVQFRTASSFLLAYSVNMSRGGIFLETDNAVPVGADIALQFSVPGVGPIALSGRVHWRREERDESGPPGIGVEFQDIGSEIGAIIDNLVEKFQGLRVLLFCTDDRDRVRLGRLIRSIIRTANVLPAPDIHLAETLIDADIDLLVVDADSGSESALRAVAKAKETALSIPVVVLASSEATRRSAQAAGADEVAPNPPPFTEFKRLLVRALGRPLSVR